MHAKPTSLPCWLCRDHPNSAYIYKITCVFPLKGGGFDFLTFSQPHLHVDPQAPELPPVLFSFYYSQLSNKIQLEK